MIAAIEPGAQALLAYLQPQPQPVAWEAHLLSMAANQRAVVRYTIPPGRPGAAPLRLIGKFYADERGAPTYQAMRALSSALDHTATPALLAIPAALFYSPQLRLLAQAHVAGRPYNTLAGQRDFRAYLRLAGRALAELHTLPVALGTPLELADHLHDLIHPHPLELAVRVPEFHTRIEQLLSALAARERAAPRPVAAAPIHRDFHLRQLFYGQQRVWLIDWDLFACGDPALDVGNFLVYLRTHLGARADAACDAFLAGYCADHASHATLHRSPIYQAFTYLRLACKRFRLQGQCWRDQADTMLRRGEACLAG